MGLRQAWREAKLAAAIERGRRLMREEKDEEYLAFVLQAGRRFPQSAEIQWMVASAMRGVGERSDEEVAAQAAKTAAIGVQDPTIQVRVGYLLIDADDVEAARLCAARAEELAGEDFVLSADLEGLKGRIEAHDGDFAAAEEKFRSVLSREPQWPSNWTQLARFLWARGRNEEALALLAESLSRFRGANDESQRRHGKIEMLERLQSEIARDTRTEPDV